MEQSSFLTQTLQNTYNQFLSVLPGFFKAVIIFILGYIIARIVARIVKRILKKLRFDELGESLNKIDFIEKSNLKIELSAIFSKAIYYFILVFFMVAATDVLGMPAISELVSNIFYFIPKLIVGLLVLIFGTILADMIKNLIQTTLSSLAIPSAKMISTFVFFFLLINVIIVAISQAEINTVFLQQNLSILIAGSVLAFAIGYGLASKDMVSNYLASFYSKGKVSLGDQVTIGEISGKVTHIDQSSVTISDDNRQIIYPLKTLIQERIIIHK